MFIEVSRFPDGYLFMRGKTSGRGIQVYAYKCHIFVDKITTVMTTSVNIKYISWFKLIWKYLRQKFNKENIFYYLLSKEVCDLIFEFKQSGLACGSPSNSSYSVKMSVCRSICVFHSFLKKYNNLFGNFADTFWGYYPGGPNTWNCF